MPRRGDDRTRHSALMKSSRHWGLKYHNGTIPSPRVHTARGPMLVTTLADRGKKAVSIASPRARV
jgi:hypothetical protein